MADEEVVEKLAEHFSAVNSDLTGLATTIPSTYSCPFPP